MSSMRKREKNRKKKIVDIFQKKKKKKLTYLVAMTNEQLDLSIMREELVAMVIATEVQ